MPALTTRLSLALTGAATILLACGLGGGVSGQRVNRGETSSKARATPLVVGAKTCANEGCHGGPPQTWIKGRDLLCRCVEADLWFKRDRHADAHLVLTGRLGKQMSELLGYDVTRAPQCLSCHAVVLEGEMQLASRRRGYSAEEGVTCVVCHGPALEWARDHGNIFTAAEWRERTPAQRAAAGLRDLADPLVRARLCVSCHVGNLKEGKFVTHEMYAAGHPPLPAFELATFSEQMPAHWQPRGEKSARVQAELEARGYRRGEKEQTRLLLVGAAATLAEQMRLLIAQAGPGAAELDLAHFDCYACHHNLVPKTWRQAAGRKLGQVPMRGGATELVRLAAVQAFGDQAGEELKWLDRATADLSAAFTARPGGDLAKVRASAEVIEKWAEELARKLAGSHLTEKDVKALLARAPGQYQGKRLDHDTARQVAWALGVMGRESSSPLPGVAGLGKEVDLKLPEGRWKDLGEAAVSAARRRGLERLYKYDAGRFAELLGGLGK